MESLAGELEARFYEAEDAGCAVDSVALFREVVAGSVGRCIRSDKELWPQTGLPSEPTRLALLHSAAQNRLGELSVDDALEAGFPTTTIDCAPVRAAVGHFEAALVAWPGNASAAYSLGQIFRDRGEGDRALALFAQIETLAASGGPSNDEQDSLHRWRECWIFEPRRSAVAVAILHLALLYSQRAQHAAAAPLLRRFGFKLRLSPHVWAAAAAAPPPALAATCARPVRMFPSCVPEYLGKQLTRAFAPGAAYWRETGYHNASAEKNYFTFFFDVESQPTNAVEALISHLRPLAETGKKLVCAEWWVHTRLAGVHPGHELHYDCEEGVMEASGEVLHPLVSSVVYLAGDESAGPTIVLDQRLDSKPARRCWLAHPRSRAFMTFPGELLHGVLPAARATPPPSQPQRLQAAEPAERTLKRGADLPAEAAFEKSFEKGQHRLTLMIAWYGVDAREKSSKRGRHSLRPQGAVPRASRRVTWPRELELDQVALRTQASPLRTSRGYLYWRPVYTIWVERGVLHPACEYGPHLYHHPCCQD
ncbi:hypothetical protein T492DRAFT_1000931 [Pavlovales sp. CCMP2436]|nr:hypothetical protein T492DRAFT_1000931 [Pavlovales sp. CCMP2436]